MLQHPRAGSRARVLLRDMTGHVSVVLQVDYTVHLTSRSHCTTRPPSMVGLAMALLEDDTAAAKLFPAYVPVVCYGCVRGRGRPARGKEGQV